MSETSQDIKHRCHCGSDTFGLMDVAVSQTDEEGRMWLQHENWNDKVLVCVECGQMAYAKWKDGGFLTYEIPRCT